MDLCWYSCRETQHEHRNILNCAAAIDLIMRMGFEIKPSWVPIRYGG